MVRNFIKYEIKGTYKNILGILALVLILTSGLYLYSVKSDTVSTFGEIFIVLSILILFGTALATFFYIVGFFRKELYEDRGYLTFTLPMNGNQIVGAKLIVALMWFTLLGVVYALYNLLMVKIFLKFDFTMSQLFNLLKEVISLKDILLLALLALFAGASTLLTIYFSMALGRVTFKDKKIGGLWFIIFIAISVILSVAQFKISDIFPYAINMNTITKEFSVIIDYGIVINSDPTALTFNIATNIFNILVTIGLFFSTGYLLERKIDL